MLGLLPPGIAIDNIEDANDAVFGYNRTTVAFGRDIINSNSRHNGQECLYVFNQYGKLSEFSLETSGARQHSRITDESPLEVLLHISRSPFLISA
jgi:hypothetical protein